MGHVGMGQHGTLGYVAYRGLSSVCVAPTAHVLALHMGKWVFMSVHGHKRVLTVRPARGVRVY